MVSSARNPNESYAQRAKKAKLTTEQKHEQVKNAPQRTSLRDDPIQHRPDLAILDRQDEHDPFVVRVPPHLSRQSSSSTNPLPATDPVAWPQLPSQDRQSNSSPSAPPSRQNSTASLRHHPFPPSGSVRPSRASHSASQSRDQSRSSSSASSPRLQIRGRTLPQDDALPPDLRLDNNLARSTHQRSSPALPDPPNHISSSFQSDPPPPSDTPFYSHPLVPPPQDMPPRYTHHFVPQYLNQQFSPTHIPGHASPPYVPPHSGQGTPPYTHYPPFPAYMYGHHPVFWGEVPPPHSHNHFQNQTLISSNYVNASEHVLPHTTELGSVTIESAVSKVMAQSQNGRQSRPSKSVVFGTIDPDDPQAESSTTPLSLEQPIDIAVERATEQFASFFIGLNPDDHGPPRLGSRKPSVRSFSRTLSFQSTPLDGAKDATVVPLPSREANGTKKPIRWEFGTTHSEDLDNLQPPFSPPLPPPNLLDEPRPEKVDDRPEPVNIPSPDDTSQADRSIDKSETDSHASDTWVVKNYGYGFGDHNGYVNAPDSRWDMREREKERVRETTRDQHRDRGWYPARQHGWRHENGTEEGKDGWDQQGYADGSRHMRPRRGSFHGFGHERGGFSGRRGRGFGGRFYGGRGRGSYFHHQRPGSYPFVSLPPPPPFEVLSPTTDPINGYGQPTYATPELESYDAIAPTTQPHIPFTSTIYSLEAMQNYLLAQLEYYLSPQNMAQDLFLRQRMDNEGWIPISLLASFKRVQQLHTDADIVKEVLSRSRTVEVSGDWVRMGDRQWEVFVLPNAPRSVVTSERGESNRPRFSLYHGSGGYTDLAETEGDCDGEDCEGDDEDDDIEFVIGEEAEGSWMSVAERKQ